MNDFRIEDGPSMGVGGFPYKKGAKDTKENTGAAENSRLEGLLERMEHKDLGEVTPELLWIFVKELIRILIYKMEGRS